MELTLPSPLERLAERSPIAVRQVRQQLRSRAWSAALIAVPALCLLSALLVFAVKDRTTEWLDGTTTARLLFASYLLVWAVFCGAIQPGSSGRALHRERNDQTWDLIELAGLGGYGIALGFWSAALVQIVLMSALFAPFLVMAWLLRGVDTGALLLALVAVPAWGTAMAALAVAGASGPLPKKKLANRVQIGTEFVALLFGAPLFALLLQADGVSRMLSAFGGGVMAIAIAASVWLLAVVGCLVHAGTALAHPARNRSTGPRFVACLAAVLIALWGVLFSRHGLSTAAVLIVLLSVWTGLGAIAEFDGTTPRQQRWLDQARGFWKHSAWFLGPGCRRGRRCVLLLAALGMGCAVASSQMTTVRGCLGIVAYAFTFLLLGDAIMRGLNAGRLHRPRQQTFVTVLIAGGTNIFGLLMLMGHHGDSVGWAVMMLMPLAAIGSLFTREASNGLVTGVGAMAVLSTAILFVQAIGRERHIVRLTNDSAAER